MRSRTKKGQPVMSRCPPQQTRTQNALTSHEHAPTSHQTRICVTRVCQGAQHAHAAPPTAARQVAHCACAFPGADSLAPFAARCCQRDAT
jgi:hypothetical protein